MPYGGAASSTSKTGCTGPSGPRCATGQCCTPECSTWMRACVSDCRHALRRMQWRTVDFPRACAKCPLRQHVHKVIAALESHSAIEQLNIGEPAEALTRSSKDKPGRRSHGAAVRAGSESFGIVCTCADRHSTAGAA